MICHPGLLSTQDEIQTLAAVLRKYEVIAFDTEFIRESTFFPIVEIIQVATDSESWLIDAQAFKKNYRAGDPQAFDPLLQPLLDVFTDPKILKILHAAQGDQECLYTSFGVVASPTLDTAVAASLCGYGDGVGLGKLLETVLDVHLIKGHARTNWSVRPLPQQLVDYAHADVTHLVELGRNLLQQLEKSGRKSWALELSAKWEDQALYQVDIDGMAQKLVRGKRMDKSAYAVLLGLLRWREDRVRSLNLPRRWTASDQVLLDLAHVRPKDMAHLSSFRGLNKGELKSSGEIILEVIRKSLEADSVTVPARAQREAAPTSDESQVLELLRCYVAILADRHKVAVKHLLTTGKLLSILRSQAQVPQDLVRMGILSEESAQLVGEELIAMVSGKRGLFANQGQVEVVKKT